MLTQQCHPDRAKRRGISNNNIQDISRSVSSLSLIENLFWFLTPRYGRYDNFCGVIPTERSDEGTQVANNGISHMRSK